MCMPSIACTWASPMLKEGHSSPSLDLNSRSQLGEKVNLKKEVVEPTCLIPRWSKTRSTSETTRKVRA